MSRRRFLAPPIVASMHAVTTELERRWPLSEFASKAGLSAYHFHRRFRAALGETPASFVERLRLERAALLLLAADVPVTELAWDVGFRNPETFARRFRARFGWPARDYRRRQIDLFARLNLSPGDDPGTEGEIQVRRLPPRVFAIRCSIGEDEGFDFDPSAEPWCDLPCRDAVERIGVNLDLSGITPPGLVRQEWGVPIEEDAETNPGILRTAGNGLFATLSVRGDGPVPPSVYQRLFVWAMAGRYRLRPGGTVELHRGGRVVVHQPVSDMKEDDCDVRVRDSDQQARP